MTCRKRPTRLPVLVRAVTSREKKGELLSYTNASSEGKVTAEIGREVVQIPAVPESSYRPMSPIAIWPVGAVRAQPNLLVGRVVLGAAPSQLLVHSRIRVLRRYASQVVLLE